MERREDGIIVRGAKNYFTMTARLMRYDEIICIPTRAAMKEHDADYAVAFALPADAEGAKLVAHVANPRPRKCLRLQLQISALLTLL